MTNKNKKARKLKKIEPWARLPIAEKILETAEKHTRPFCEGADFICSNGTVKDYEALKSFITEVRKYFTVYTTSTTLGAGMETFYIKGFGTIATSNMSGDHVFSKHDLKKMRREKRHRSPEAKKKRLTEARLPSPIFGMTRSEYAKSR